MTREMPYPDNPGQTHYDGCWRVRGHHNCAVERIAALEAEVERLRGFVEDDCECLCEYDVGFVCRRCMVLSQAVPVPREEG